MTNPYTFKCCCGAMFGTRAKTVDEAMDHAREHRWIVKRESLMPGSSIASCPDCGPVSESERVAVLALLGAPDPRLALDRLNEKGRAIVDDVALRLRAGERQMARRQQRN